MVFYSASGTIGLYFIVSSGSFDPSAAVREYPLANGRITKHRQHFRAVSRGGRIDQVEAVTSSVPYATKPELWDSRQ
jgi:hypothetical protein